MFGDSWPAGEELERGEKTFGEILSERFNVGFKNYSQPMTSIAHMLLQVNLAIEDLDPTDNPVAIFCLTSVSRSIRFEDSYLPGNWEEIQIARKDPASRAYYQYIHSDKLDQLMTASHLLALQKICQNFKIPDYYVCCWTRPEFFLPGLEKLCIYPKTLLEILDSSVTHSLLERFTSTKYVKMGGCHPNQQGHIKIADTLSSWTDLRNNFYIENVQS